MSLKKKRMRDLIWILSINIFLFITIILVFLLYASDYRNKFREQNVADIININQSSANIGGAFFQSQQKELADIVRYVTLHKLNYTEVLTYIYDSHSDKKTNYELIGTDCKGYVALRINDEYVPVDYTHTDYKTFDSIFTSSSADYENGIQYTPEFTDSYTACRSFALYARLSLDNGSGVMKRCTLLAVSQSRAFSSLIELNGGYEGMSLVFVDSEGEYILGSPEFKSNNLFKYLSEYNGISLDEQKKIINNFHGSVRGEYFYKNSRGQNCIFEYTSVPGTKWYCVSSVPLASFRENNIDLKFTILISTLLLFLMCFNMIWLDLINHKLKASVQNEKAAGAAKTEFLSRMSHDIRTPMNVIIGMTLLAKKENNPPETRRYLEDINQSGKFLLSLVNDILDLNKVESGKMELHLAPYSYKQFASNIKTMISTLCEEKKINFEINTTTNGCLYMLDSVRVEQIFFNLLSNSIKFTSPGGHIKIECHEKDIDDTHAELYFETSDDGIGMSQEFQEHMFEAFSQEQNNSTMANQGTGLGLAIVKRLIDLMNGTVRVKSAPNCGTIFFIKLPVVKAKDKIEEEKQKETSVTILQGKRVLLFEDNELNAEIAGTLLKDKGMIVEYAENGKVGVDHFIDSTENYFNIVLMDLRMPIMDGFEATRAIRALKRKDATSIPIIAMTANAYDIDVQNCLEAGMNAHLAKPINPDVLFAVLIKEIAKET